MSQYEFYRTASAGDSVIDLKIVPSLSAYQQQYNDLLLHSVTTNGKPNPHHDLIESSMRNEDYSKRQKSKCNSYINCIGDEFLNLAPSVQNPQLEDMNDELSRGLGWDFSCNLHDSLERMSAGFNVVNQKPTLSAHESYLNPRATEAGVSNVEPQLDSPVARSERFVTLNPSQFNPIVDECHISQLNSRNHLSSHSAVLENAQADPNVLRDPLNLLSLNVGSVGNVTRRDVLPKELNPGLMQNNSVQSSEFLQTPNSSVPNTFFHHSSSPSLPSLQSSFCALGDRPNGATFCSEQHVKDTNNSVINSNGIVNCHDTSTATPVSPQTLVTHSLAEQSQQSLQFLRNHSTPKGPTSNTFPSFQHPSLMNNSTNDLTSLGNLTAYFNGESSVQNDCDASDSLSTSDFLLQVLRRSHNQNENYISSPFTNQPPATDSMFAFQRGRSYDYTNGPDENENKPKKFSRVTHSNNKNSPVSRRGSAGNSGISKKPRKSVSPKSESALQDKFDSDENLDEDSLWFRRPDIDDETLNSLCDVTSLHADERFSQLMVDYHEGISYPLGEGGRELLRACLNSKGCKGRQLQGASVPMLLQLARDWGLWNVAVRIKVERATGELSMKHEAFVRFKAMQSQLRKYLKREQMQTERDCSGKITDIRFEEMKYLTLGKDGREKLRTHLRRMHDKDPQRMDELLEQHCFRYSELRNATVPQLLKMAYICGIWNEVIDACRRQEQKKDEKLIRRDFQFPRQSFEETADLRAKLSPRQDSLNVVDSYPASNSGFVTGMSVANPSPDIVPSNHQFLHSPELHLTAPHEHNMQHVQMHFDNLRLYL